MIMMECKELNKIISLMRRMGENVSYEECMFPIFSENMHLPVIIEESLIKSYDTDRVISFISEKFHLDNGEKNLITIINPDYKNKNKIYKVEAANNCDLIIVKTVKEFTEKNKLNYYFKKYGWFLSRVDEDDDSFKYTYEKKFNEEIFCFQLKTQLRYLYHITDKSNVENILKKGLKTKSKDNQSGYMNDERLYLLLGIPDKYQIQITACSNPVRLKIDLNKLNDIFKFYHDPRVNNAVYTFEQIPPNVIEIIQ